MRIFIDTSALAKHFFQEEGTQEVQDILTQADMVYVSILSLPETFSTLARKKREEKVSTRQYIEIKKAIVKDFRDFNISELSPRIISKSIFLLEKYSIRTLDAIHLASALEIYPDIFVSSDHQQLKVAKVMKLKTLSVL